MNSTKMSTEIIVESMISCLVPTCPKGNDCSLTENDFAHYKSVIDDRLSELSDQVSSWIASNQCNVDSVEIISAAIVLCGEHSTSSIWTTEASLRLSNDIFSSISSYYEHLHSQHVFHDTKVIKNVLSFLRPYLLAETFRCNPAATICYGWLLKKIKCSILGNFMRELLPTALILADDCEPQNMILGLESLNYIIENIAIEKLKLCSYDIVIMDVLKKCLHLREPDIVSSHLKCFIILMSKCLGWNKSLKRFDFDELMYNILVNMYMEQKLNLRRLYISNMPKLIDARGLGVVRHLNIIFKILSEYALESTTTSGALKALAKTVEVCWCRGDYVGENVLVIMMKVLIFLSRPSSLINFVDVSPELHKLADLLNEAFPTVVNKFLNDLRENWDSLDENLQSLAKDVFMPTGESS